MPGPGQSIRLHKSTAFGKFVDNFARFGIALAGWSAEGL
jgi:hypothetical protein